MLLLATCLGFCETDINVAMVGGVYFPFAVHASQWDVIDKDRY
jgi:hypothetical protein